MELSTGVASARTSIARHGLLTSPKVVALQYYNACLVLLRQHKPPDNTLHGFEAVKERRNNEVREVIPIE